MRKPAAGLCLLTLLLCWGCTPKTEPPGSGADRQIQDPWKASQSSHVQVQAEPLGQLPNSGLQLPVVSPDGKWIAFLDCQDDLPPEPRCLFTGRGLEPMSLHIRSAEATAQPRILAESGAAWPSWSADSKTLLFIAYQQNGRCDLVVCEPQTGMTRRLSISLKPIMMPALSPSGTRAAVVVFEPRSQSARLHVVNLSTGNIEHTCPADSQSAQQLWPQWTPDGRIIFVLNQDGQSRLVQWRPGKSPPQELAEIYISPTLAGIYQAFAGLGRPLSADARHFAYYDTAQDRIVLLSLADGQRVELPVGTRAGCWFGSGRFVAADQKQMRLFSIPPSMSALLMRGLWLPRGANPGTSQLLLCSRAAEARAFALMRMKILSVE